MNTSSRFIVAIHLLAILSIRKKVTSDDLAWSANTNLVVIRRILGALREVGLVHSQPGPQGGFTLACPAEQITLLEVYDAVEPGQLFHLHYSNPLQSCPIGSHIQTCMSDVFEETSEAVRNVLRDKTIAQVADDILVRTGLKKLLDAGMSMAQIDARYTLANGRLIDRELEA